MSRRPNPAADRAEQNRATLKSLVKLEANKSCADCKRNKRMLLPGNPRPNCPSDILNRSTMGQLEPRHLYLHSVCPFRHFDRRYHSSRSDRWYLWYPSRLHRYRCSGIHRGMGTHISRVKSVDLDSWTDEQLQSVLKWGNARANKSVQDKPT